MTKAEIDELRAAARAMEQALTTYIKTGFTGLAFHALNNEAKRVRTILAKGD